ncbi:replication activator protein Pra [Streptantibioticus cattleyicolor NRRL 8057 = DSM 46488]|uniref:Replication activator protein Pra n=1 Tax=Streptantibioticus cattleyicolor (strain ATCC 35852 / DSM 46488 / JCM 4925 / NBRC 14057 / NRRL 8057) TaxID=1003195 RepID=G8WSB2_STREN|nr:replication activator protein Pra [Streptantibioticus cattleyicolor NRRL 8057 = DSM 46488]
MAAPVSLPGLVARSWESTCDGQQRHGIAFRAADVAPAVYPATAEAA